MSSPAPPPKLAEETEENVDLGEESDDYDAEFDVNACFWFCLSGNHTLNYRVLFREKKEKKDITKRKMMKMKRTTKMRKRRRVYNRYVFF